MLYGTALSLLNIATEIGRIEDFSLTQNDKLNYGIKSIFMPQY